MEEFKLDAQKMVDVLIAQRNEALDKAAYAQAMMASMHDELQKLRDSAEDRDKKPE